MISCIITAYKEPRTIGAAIKALIEQPWPEEFEILVVCPDQETNRVIRIFTECYTQVQHLTDKGEGKPAALNVALARARGHICIFSDGDVVVQEEAISALLKPFTDPHCGAVTGRPISASPRSSMLGYWSHLLTDAGAHALRLRNGQKQRYMDGSGYLYAVRRTLLAPLPPDILADDTYISQRVWQQGYSIVYAPTARVAVRYPTTYHDWLLQKVRSSTGATINPRPLQATQPGYARPPEKMRSFQREAISGLGSALRYANTWQERWWTWCLLGARIHLWLCVWLEIHVKHRTFQEIWQRVETTK
jgi:Glycosyltransferases, probably involved in cell wall biogenesis